MTILSDEYRTLFANSKGSFKDKGSKFYAFAYPVSSEDEIKIILADLRKKYHDARHHCYAYRLGPEKLKYRANDDGEPSSSAGKPILGQLLSFDLTDVLIVVIRYFGGTLLGIPGLINAYRSAAREAIEDGEIVTKTVKDRIKINFDYLAMNSVMRIIKEDEAKIINQLYDMECEIEIEVRRRLTARVIEKLNKIDKLKTILMD
jgi:uncharacterized YigZ family protein